MENSNGRLKTAVYGVGFLMMGGLGVSGSLAKIALNFQDVSQVMIQNLVSVPCIMIIPTTLVVGRLMRSVAKKPIAVAGILIFIVAGVAPAFMSSFGMILAVRGIFGIGLGICQVVGNALVAENFRGAEKDKAQGALLASAMSGAAVMVFLSGILANINWRLVFYVYLIAVLPLFFSLFFLHAPKPAKSQREEKTVTKITGACWGWVGAMFVTYISAQAYPVFVSFLIEEGQLGGASDSALGMVFFAVGGILAGLLFGEIRGVFRRHTLTAGCLLLAVSNVLIAFSVNVAMCWAGSLMIGAANIVIASCIFLGAGMSVGVQSSGMAISLVSCAQNLSQFCSPFIIMWMAASIGKYNINFTAFLCAGAIALALAASAFISGLRGQSV